MGVFSRKRYEPIAPTEIGAFVASGATYRVSSYADATNLSMQRQEWQQTAFNIYNMQGHLYYATNYVGSALARIKLVAAKRPKDDTENTKPEIIKEGPIAEAVRQIRSSRGGQRLFLRQAARNVFLTGEVWLVAQEVLINGVRRQVWDAVSINELRVSGSSQTFLLRSLPGAAGKPLPEGALTIRIWKEHPEFSELADSGVRSCIDLLEKVIITNKAEKAVARSVLAGAGVLALPMELVPPAWQNQNGNPNVMESNPLWQALAESMTAPLKDEGHPSSVVPLVLVGPGDVIGKMKYEPLARNFDTEKAAKSISSAVDQIASTLELPKEILLGTGEATHWTAWSIREDTFQAHIQPLIELICDALTTTYLQAALASMSPDELKAAGVSDPSEIIVWYDASQLIIRPDKASAAQALHDRFAISDSALRRENGFNDSDAPEEEEYKKRVGIKMADAGMAVSGEPTPPPAPGGAGPVSAGTGGANPKVPRTTSRPGEASPPKGLDLSRR